MWKILAVYNPQNDRFWFTKQRVYFLRGGRTPLFLFWTVLSLRAFDCVCYALSIWVFWFFFWFLFCSLSSFFLVLFGGCCFVCTFAVHIWRVGTGSLAVYRHEVGYHWPHFFLFQNLFVFEIIIRKTTGFGFSKRWVSFHKTTRIFFEGGGHTPLFLFCALSRIRSLNSLRVLSRFFCSFWVGASVFHSFLLPFFLFSLFFVVGLYFFLILFGGFEFVRTFAAKNDGTITCRLERVQASVVTAFFFCYINFMLFSVCHFAFELYFYTVPRCFVNGEITWRHGGCLMGLNRAWTGFVQWLFNGCSMVVTICCGRWCRRRAWMRLRFLFHLPWVLAGWVWLFLWRLLRTSE